MRKYTQEEFDQFPADECGYKQCPSGDYTLIQKFPEYCSFGDWCSFGEGCSFGKCCSFGEGCSFGEWCSFGKCCSFGEWCSFGKCCSFGKWCKCEFGEFQAMYTAGGFGSKGRTTYFFHMADGSICVRCGCFKGTVDEWESEVRQTHGVTPYAQAYLLIGAAVKAMCQK